MASAEAFELHERELLGIIEGIQRNVTFLADATGERRRIAVSETERSLSDARSLLRKMGPMARDLPQRAQLQMRIRQHDSELARLERQMLTSVPSPGAIARAEMEDAEGRQRDKLKSGLERVDRTGARLENTERVGLESEAIGTSVLADLHGQREVLEGVDDKLGHVDDTMSRSKRLLVNMARRLATNKCILALIITIQVITVLLIVFFKWIYPFVKAMERRSN